MKTISRTFYYHKFDEKKNEIALNEKIVAERSMTEEEVKQYKKKSIFVWFWRILFFVSFAAFLAITIACCMLPHVCLTVMLLSVGVTVGVSFAFAIRTENDLENLLEYFANSGFQLENMIWEERELAVNDEAKAWREAHPLEEKIRKAKESGNCVDIAAVLKYCGEDLVDKIKH